mmetsp:Transcript_62717/g.102916  ORF Transcript_62717/g.102916 Transcript_62717/m.102916 type:complete len:220 (+) Transcript_62717:312-971(+)
MLFPFLLIGEERTTGELTLMTTHRAVGHRTCRAIPGRRMPIRQGMRRHCEVITLKTAPLRGRRPDDCRCGHTLILLRPFCGSTAWVARITRITMTWRSGLLETIARHRSCSGLGSTAPLALGASSGRTGHAKLQHQAVFTSVRNDTWIFGQHPRVCSRWGNGRRPYQNSRHRCSNRLNSAPGCFCQASSPHSSSQKRRRVSRHCSYGQSTCRETGGNLL